MQTRSGSSTKSKIIRGNSAIKLRRIRSNSVDLVATDPPYLLAFLNKGWDKPSKSLLPVFKQCYRVLKPGGFAFVMSSPRQDLLLKMIVTLRQAGFETGFPSIYWAYTSGMPKGYNVATGIESLKVLGTSNWSSWKNLLGIKGIGKLSSQKLQFEQGYRPKDYSGQVVNLKVRYTTSAAKKFDGAVARFQPKPAVEVIIVAMKPITESNHVLQALKNGKGVTWLKQCRIPHADGTVYTVKQKMVKHDEFYKKDGRLTKVTKESWYGRDTPKALQVAKILSAESEFLGRYPANLLVADNVLEDDSKNFSLDAWWRKQLPKKMAHKFPFLMVSKPSPREKMAGTAVAISNKDTYDGKFPSSKADRNVSDKHPTVKPIELFCYLITLGSRPGDTVLDPFLGMGTTCIAAHFLGRKWIGIEKSKAYYQQAKKHIWFFLKNSKAGDLIRDIMCTVKPPKERRLDEFE